ncbi:MAG: UDP-glucose--hexose-1-phosphate uridylyltransferase, partial [Coriobacteriales bacterium]
MDISTTVLELVDYAITHEFIDECDRIWAYNTVLAAIGEQGAPLSRLETHASAANGALADRIPTIKSSDLSFDLNAVLDELTIVAKENDVVPLTGDGDDGIRGWIMSLLMPRPHEVARTFASLHAKDPQQATSWFYRLCGDVDYVHRKAIANDIKWRTPTQWGELEITINLSKPEKDPRDIARAAHDVSGDAYPRCQLCMENEGYPGRPATSPLGAHPARRNLRIVPLILGGEQWGLQYSPYAYFNEHCIAMSEEHRPMHVDHGTFVRLLDFIKLFPHYFIGSNADLPIVGGSILSHDHFQGG